MGRTSLFIHRLATSLVNYTRVDGPDRQPRLIKAPTPLGAPVISPAENQNKSQHMRNRTDGDLNYHTRSRYLYGSPMALRVPINYCDINVWLWRQWVRIGLIRCRLTWHGGYHNPWPRTPMRQVRPRGGGTEASFVNFSVRYIFHSIYIYIYTYARFFILRSYLTCVTAA